MHDFDRAICKWVKGNDGETKKIRRKNCVKEEEEGHGSALERERV